MYAFLGNLVVVALFEVLQKGLGRVHEQTI